MNKHKYYCITKNNKVIYVSTSEKACYELFYKLDGDYNISVIKALGVLYDNKPSCEKRPLVQNKKINTR